MSDVPYNPDDPAFLLSRSLDEKLTKAEQQQLDQALASSEALRTDADRFRRLHQLINRWGAKPVDLDWEHHAALMEAQLIGTSDADKLGKIDQLLGQWASQTVSIDEGAFKTAVLARVRAQRKTKPWHRVIFRLGVPLAAAAAVVFAVTGILWNGPDARSKLTIEIGPSLVMVTPSDHDADLLEPVVMFGQEEDSQEVTKVSSARTSSGVSFIAIGASRIGVGAANVPP